ncbi:MAG: N-acetylglucosamine-6-phosphate deacetylase [Candidatus Omnitrophota bacterium]
MPRHIYIINAKIISKGALLKGAAVLISGTKIASLGKKTALCKNSLSINAKGCFVSPGFIDTHIHGDPERVFLNEIRSGTTSIMPALSCDSFANIFKKIDRIKTFAGEEPFGPNVLGIRIEGPYINKSKAGAQDKRYIRKPDAKELAKILKRCGRSLKIMTVAPELKGTLQAIRILKAKKVIASIGHSAATYEEAIAGIDAGVSHATHTFNAMSGKEAPKTGAVGAALADERVTAEVIPDLVHVRETLLRLLLKTKIADRIILITDSVRAEAADKSYPQCSGRLNVRYCRGGADGGVYRLKDGRLAGSCLTMIEAIKNAVSAGALSVPDAVRLATENPARLLGLQRRKGTIAKGMDADIVVFDKNFDVKMTIIRGEIVYRKKTRGEKCAE